MKKFKIFAFTGLMLLGLGMFAQSGSDDIIFQAMQDELKRNHENLKLESNDKPFFIDYSISRYSSMSVTASLGGVSGCSATPSLYNEGVITLLTGNKTRTNSTEYGVSGRFAITSEIDYNELRRNLWLVTDWAYKRATQEYASKMAYLKANPKSDKDKAINDFSEAKITNSIIDDNNIQMPDTSEWKKNMVILSDIFKKYPTLRETSVSFLWINSTFYKTTSEGLKIKKPMTTITISSRAKVIAKDSVLISDMWELYALSIQEIPSMEELKKKITEFAEGLIRLSQADPMNEYYSGPILFEDKACMSTLKDNLFKQGYLIAKRKPEGNNFNSTNIDERINRKIIDSRLTVKNLTSIKSYNGKPIHGAYEVDYDGVVPQKEVTLIENGIFLKQLNGRVPTLNAPVSTGNTLRGSSLSSYTNTSEAIVHVSVKGGMKQEKMKKELMKAAAQENLPFAYIVKSTKADNASLVYRVDTKTGVETQVRMGDLVKPNLAKLKRIREISSKESVENYNETQTFIFPTSMIIDDVEINVSQPKKEKPSALTFPLERK